MLIVMLMNLNYHMPFDGLQTRTKLGTCRQYLETLLISYYYLKYSHFTLKEIIYQVEK